MPAFTAHLNMYLPGGGSLGIGGDDEPADIDKLNQNFQKIDDWSEDTDTRLTALEPLLARNQQFTGPAANIGSVTGMKLGDTYQETDVGKRLLEYDGTAWISAENGLYLIRPTAVSGTGVTIDNAGHIALASATGNISFDGAFSSRFDHYLVDIQVDTASSDVGLSFNFRAAAADLVGSTYYSSLVENAIGIGPLRQDFSATASAALGRVAVNGGAVQLDISRPSKTVGAKVFQVRSTDAASYSRTGGGYFTTTTTAVDGIRIAIGVVTLTGKIKIYGYR